MNDKLVIVSTTKMKTVIKEHLNESFPDAVFIWSKSIEEAREHLYKADIILTYGEDLTTEDITAASRLQWIMVISAGMDKMPFEAIDQKGIKVTNVKGIHGKPMAEYTVFAILQHARQGKQYYKQEQQKIWSRRAVPVEVEGRNVTILGAGSIGTETAKAVKRFDMHTTGVNTKGRAASHFDKMYSTSQLKEAVSSADYVVNVLPLTDETENIMDWHVFEAMKEEAVFINIGRGSTVQEEDLIDALQKGVIHHAVLDVFNQEPLGESHPFWEMENVTVTPHISGISSGYIPRAMDIFEQNLKAFLRHPESMINAVDVKKGY